MSAVTSVEVRIWGKHLKQRQGLGYNNAEYRVCGTIWNIKCVEGEGSEKRGENRKIKLVSQIKKSGDTKKFIIKRKCSNMLG